VYSHFTSCVLPLQAFVSAVPGAQPLLEGVERNLEHWKSQEPAVAAAASPHTASAP